MDTCVAKNLLLQDTWDDKSFASQVIRLMPAASFWDYFFNNRLEYVPDNRSETWKKEREKWRDEENERWMTVRCTDRLCVVVVMIVTSFSWLVKTYAQWLKIPQKLSFISHCQEKICEHLRQNLSTGLFSISKEWITNEGFPFWYFQIIEEICGWTKERDRSYSGCHFLWQMMTLF